jgi:hypothetical protein
VTRRIHVCYVTHSYVLCDSFMCVVSYMTEAHMNDTGDTTRICYILPHVTRNTRASFICASVIYVLCASFTRGTRPACQEHKRCCSVLQCVAVRCSVLQCFAVCCSVLQEHKRCCSVLQCVAVCCRVSHGDAVCCSVLQCVAVCCRNIRDVAVCCSALQCVAVCCTA